MSPVTSLMAPNNKNALALAASLALLSTTNAMANPYDWTFQGEFNRIGASTYFDPEPFKLDLHVDLEGPAANIDPVPGAIYGAVGQRSFHDIVTSASLTWANDPVTYTFSGTQYGDGTADYGDMFLINDDWDRLNIRTGARNGEWQQTAGNWSSVLPVSVVLDIFDYAAFGVGDEPTATMFNGWAFPNSSSFMALADTAGIRLAFENGYMLYGNVNSLSITGGSSDPEPSTDPGPGANPQTVPEPGTPALLGLGLIGFVMARKRQPMRAEFPAGRTQYEGRELCAT